MEPTFVPVGRPLPGKPELLELPDFSSGPRQGIATEFPNTSGQILSQML